MTQQEIKAMASEMVGDGQSPNKYFVTVSSYCFLNPRDEEMSLMSTSLNGETSITTVYDSYEDALDEYDSIELDFKYGAGSVMIEDRETGILLEKYLRAVVKYETFED